MASIFDVARYITERKGEMTAMKLQKLMYYSQAWHLVWEEDALFADDFEAWANGPVLPNLYARHRGQFKVNAALFPDGNVAALTDAERKAVDKVLDFYANQTAQWLSDLTHQERPWLESRGDTPRGAASSALIPKSLMDEYYSSL